MGVHDISLPKCPDHDISLPKCPDRADDVIPRCYGLACETRGGPET